MMSSGRLEETSSVGASAEKLRNCDKGWCAGVVRTRVRGQGGARRRLMHHMAYVSPNAQELISMANAGTYKYISCAIPVVCTCAIPLM
jgi:hypothetical protein